MIRTELVGRDREMAALRDSVDEALAGRPRLVLCRGEPGIGKTRLAEELVAWAAQRGVATVWGRAVESAGAPPYWPWRQVLRGAGEMSDLRAVADEHRLTLDLRRLAPDVFGQPGPPADGAGSTEDRFLQFDAVGRLLRQLAAQRPLTIMLDDAHLADEPSLLLLQHVARTLTDERVLVVVNYRDTEHTTGAPLMALLREPLTKEIHLRGLSAAAVGRQLASVVGYDVDEAEVEHVYAVTRGNPFFVTEMGRALADERLGRSSAPVTITIREAIAARLDRLSPGCMQLLRAASVLGRDFSAPVVGVMLDLAPADCLAALDEAATAGFVESGSTPGEQRFVHALIRDAIEAGLGTSERVRLHRGAAEALEKVYLGRLGPRLFDLARHWAVAAVEGDRARATGWIGEAAEEALRQLAYEDAAGLFRLALEVGAEELDAAARCRLLLGLGGALHLSSDLPGGLEACVEVASIARDIGRSDLMAEAALVIAPTLVPEVDLTIRRLCDQATAALASQHPALAARVWARFAETCEFLADGAGARRGSHHALALAEECDDPTALVAALRARQLGCSDPDGLDERADLAARMSRLGRDIESPEAQLSGQLWLIDVAFERGDLTGVAREIEVAAWLADEARGPLGRWDVLRARAVLAQAQARFETARRFADEAFEVLAPTGHPIAAMIHGALLGTMAHQTGHDEESLAAYGLADATADELDFPKVGVIRTLAPAQVLIEVGRLSEAAALYRSVGPATGWEPSLHSTLPSYAFGLAAAVALDVSDDVRTLRDLLSPYRGHHVVAGAGGVSYFGPVELWVGIAAGHLGLLDDAVTDLEQAVRACAVSGAAGFHAEAQYELAAVLAKRSASRDLARARSLVADAAGQAADLGMLPIAAKARGLIAQLDADAPDASLTPREREVANLVAQGLTNRQIAENLFLSERTAQNHVQHILTKLDLSNRSQIAVWVTKPEMSMQAE